MEIVTSKLMGGLGNYLFQISTAYSVSIRDNKIFICDANDVLKIHKPYTDYCNNIFKNINFSFESYDYNIYSEPNFDYKEIPKIKGNLKLDGYFQSENYFLVYREKILSLFNIDDETLSHLNNKYFDVLNTDTCSIHVRRGDYVSLQQFHPLQTIDYYKNAVNEMGVDKNYLIFSDDIGWCKNNFNFIKNKIYVEGNKDYEDLYLMSMCKNNIIANSSFSWWGAWLNKNENKKVIAPSKWFGINNSHLNTNYLYCPKWEIL